MHELMNSPQFATSTPIVKKEDNNNQQHHFNETMARLSASPADHFLMHQARFAAAAAAAAAVANHGSSPLANPRTNMSSSFNTSSSSNSSPNTNSSFSDKSSSSASGNDTPMSRTNQYKKIMKPLLERKRRARINKCLDELKEIMTVALQAQGENVSKLEKADILELTVRHLHKLQQSQRLLPMDPMEEVQRFQAGYSSCAQEAAAFLLQSPEVDVRVSQKLLNHLSSSSTLAAVNNNPFINRNLHHSSSSSSSSNTNPLRLNNGFQMNRLKDVENTKTNSLDNRVIKPTTTSSSSSAFVCTNSMKKDQDSLSLGSPSSNLETTKSSNSPPPRPSSNPETLATFTVAITKAEKFDDSNQSSINDESNAKMPIKPSPIRLNLNDPVWRPF